MLATTAGASNGEESRVYHLKLSHAAPPERRTAAPWICVFETLSASNKVYHSQIEQATKRPRSGGRAVARGRWLLMALYMQRKVTNAISQRSLAVKGTARRSLGSWVQSPGV